MNAQTTALTQLSHRFGSTHESISSTGENERLIQSNSLPVEHQTASSDEEDDEGQPDPAINILPPIINEDGASNRRISFINNADEIAFHTSASGDILCTITPGLGVFLTTSSRHTPHVFERVLERIHVVC